VVVDEAVGEDGVANTSTPARRERPKKTTKTSLPKTYRQLMKKKSMLFSLQTHK